MVSLLFVDDDPELLDLGRIFLERNGNFSVITSSTAAEGLSKIRSGGVDAVVSDYQMPDMDGIEFLKQVRADQSDIPFILFTGKGREEVVIQAINNGVDFYLQKGGDQNAQFSELCHKIHQAVRRKNAEDELRVAYEKNQGLMDHANDGIVIIDVDSGMIIDANKKALEFLGKTRSEVQKMHHCDLHPAEYADRCRELFQKHVTIGSGIEEGVIVDAGGCNVPVIISLNILDLEGKKCIMGIFHDISEIKKVHNALRLANNKLNLLSDITRHDIQNKLLSMNGYMKMFSAYPPEPEYSMYIKYLQESVNAIKNDIEFTRLYQNLGMVAPEWQNVQDVFFRASVYPDLKKIRIVADTKYLEIFADPLLERVFYNLVENSIRHGVRVTSIRLSAALSSDGLVIRIEDDGVGVPEQDKEKIFLKDFGKNTGHGLFMAREILSITGISIMENGISGQGARFELRIAKPAFRFTPSVNYS
jgi:PAS domain S-box-containing protein